MTMTVVDLRSDTVTRPSEGMRRALAAAEVGDDIYGEDPTVRALEERVAALLGKERALLVPSGTFGNQLALMCQTRRGDEIVVGEGAHSAWFESGAAGALSGVQIAVAGQGGLFDADELERAIKPDAFYVPRTSLVVIENTHNRAGGRVFPLPLMRAVCERARRLGLGVHLDGARLWNASVASGEPLAALAEGADTVSVCFSKGLGAPVGSVLAGPAETLQLALRYRRMLGGAMRQAGVLAAAALYGLDHNLERLAEDHANARALALVVAGAHGARVVLEQVETNIVNIELEAASEAHVIEQARAEGVLLGSIAPKTLRAVTHLDVGAAACRSAAEKLARVIERVHRSSGSG